MLRQLSHQTYLALDLNDQSFLVRTLQPDKGETLPWLPHPRSLTDIVRYVSILERNDLDARIAHLIRALAYAYGILPDGR